MFLRSAKKGPADIGNAVGTSTPTTSCLAGGSFQPTALTFSDADDTFVDTDRNLTEVAAEEVFEADLEASFNEITVSFRDGDGSIVDVEKTTLDPRNSSGLNTDICGICYTGWYQASRKCIQCDNCDLWFHASCVGIKSDSQYKKISGQDWYCFSCSAPHGQLTEDIHKATSQPEPVSILSQAIRDSRTSSSPICDPDLPQVEQPRRSLSSAKWGVLKGQKIAEIVNSTYDVVVTWRRNLFLVPTGAIGQQFIEEVTKTVNYFTSSSALYRRSSTHDGHDYASITSPETFQEI